MTRPSLQLLGPPVLRGADQCPLDGGASQPRRIAVLAMLADAWPAPMLRVALAREVWPDQGDAAARRFLAESLAVLRRELGAVLVERPQDVLLEPTGIDVDLIAFRDAVARHDDAQAVALHRGGFMEGFRLGGTPEFDNWLFACRAAVRTMLEDAARREVVETLHVDGTPIRTSGPD